MKGTAPERSFTTTVNDGSADSDPVTSAVNIVDSNDAPVLDDSAVTDGDLYGRRYTGGYS